MGQETKIVSEGRRARGPEGPTGPTGPAGSATSTGATGPTGSAGSGGLLKFSGICGTDSESAVTSYLADAGFDDSDPDLTTSKAPSYPVAVAHSLVNLATNISLSPVIPGGGSVTIKLLKNGSPVAGFSITYGPGQSGVMSAVAGPAAYAIGDTFDVEVISTDITAPLVDVSATVGID